MVQLTHCGFSYRPECDLGTICEGCPRLEAPSPAPAKDADIPAKVWCRIAYRFRKFAARL
jgi:hypothetical protein